MSHKWERLKRIKKISYVSIVGSLMYVKVCIRLNIAYIVSGVSRFLSNPSNGHWIAIKWIFRYLGYTSIACLYFSNDKPVLNGYIDRDMACDIDSRKFIFDYLITFFMGNIVMAI